MTQCVTAKIGEQRKESEIERRVHTRPHIYSLQLTNKIIVRRNLFFVIFGIFMRRIKLFLSQSIHVEDIFKPGIRTESVRVRTKSNKLRSFSVLFFLFSFFFFVKIQIENRRISSFFICISKVILSQWISRLYMLYDLRILDKQQK